MIRGATLLATALRGGGPSCEHVRSAGVDALVARPADDGAPVVVYVNACLRRGIEEPAIARLLGGIARAGFVAVAPELPDVRSCEVTPATVEALVRVARAAGPRVALLGASTGAGLAILAAGDPKLADRVTAVAAVAPVADVRSLLRLGTTGTYAGRPFACAPVVATLMARSLLAVAPADPTVPALLGNRDPERFDRLYAALAAETRAVVDAISPLTRIADVLAPVEILASAADRFCPVGEARALARTGGTVRLTITGSLDHVRPRLQPGLVRVLLALDRTLRRAAREPGMTTLPVLAT